MRALLPGLLLLAGCVSQPARTVRSLDAGQQRLLLQQQQQFSVTGRVGVSNAGQGFNASFDWRQQRNTSVLKLSGPMGAGSLTVRHSPGILRVETSRGEVFENDRAEVLLLQQLGFTPPFESLRYWILGVSAPAAEAAQESVGDDGRLLGLQQQQWQLSFERSKAVPLGAGIARLPGKLVAIREGLKLTVVIDRWKFD